VECPAQGRQVYRDHDPASIEVLLGDRAEGQDAVARGLEIVAPSGATLCEADIALVVLDRPIANIKPLGVGVGGIAVGDTVRSVGFGRTSDQGAAGFKLVRESVPVLGVTPAEFTVGEATCQGDSGGPAIDEESGEVVGVVSRGGPSCQGSDVHNVYTRVDTYAWLVDMALARSGAYDKKSADAGPKGAPRANGEKPTTDMGNACNDGAGCATGMCLVSGKAGYCTRRCGDGTRCPARYNCRKVERDSVCVKVR
jgi:Trypsin